MRWGLFFFGGGEIVFFQLFAFFFSFFCGGSAGLEVVGLGRLVPWRCPDFRNFVV